MPLGFIGNVFGGAIGAAASAANKARIPLAKMAVEETGMGVVEDKVIKNNYASEYIYNAYKDTKTCGIIEEDKAFGIKKVADPIGVIAAVIPTTNPTSTAIFKCLLALKTRNAIIISPHPRAKNCTIAAAKLVLEAAVAAGAPEGIIDWIDVPSLEMTNTVMKEADIILAFEMLEAYRAMPYLKEGGKMIVNTQEIDPMPVITGAMEYPENIKEKLSEKIDLLPVNALELAKEAGNAKAVNVVLIGVLAKSTDIPYEAWVETIKKTVPEKFLEINLKAFELGYNL